MEDDTIKVGSYIDDTTPYTYEQSFDEITEKLEIVMLEAAAQRCS